jgi:cystinosin
MGLDRCGKWQDCCDNQPSPTHPGQIYTLTYIKLLATLFKYIPQLSTNHRRRSTEGFSITAVLLDVGGGILSLTQLFLDARRQTDWVAGMSGNSAKLGLAVLSLLADGMFVVQHYVLYGAADHAQDDHVYRETARNGQIDGTERSPLLGRKIVSAL